MTNEWMSWLFWPPGEDLLGPDKPSLAPLWCGSGSCFGAGEANPVYGAFSHLQELFFPSG